MLAILTQTAADKMEVIVDFCMILIICLVGSYTKDYMRIMNCKISSCINMRRIALSTVFATIVIFCLEPYIVHNFGARWLIFGAYTAGLCGFQALEVWSTLEGIGRTLGWGERFLLDFREFRKVQAEKSKDGEEGE